MVQQHDTPSAPPKRRHVLLRRRSLIIAACAVVLAIIITLILLPPRSVASFCRVVKEQKTTLMGNVNYEKSLDAYKKLEAVSPDEIRPDITAIRKGYETMIRNPAEVMSTGFGMMGSEGRRSDYIRNNCTEFLK